MTTLSPELSSCPRSKDVTLAVLHATAGGSVEGAIETLRQRGLSYHAIIAKNGTMTKCIKFSECGFHAGNSYGPHEQAAGVSRAQDGQGNFTAKPTPCVNGYSVGIAFVNMDDGKDPYTPEQFQAAKELIAALRGQFPKLSAITTHAIVSPRRKVDPLGFDIDKLGEAVGLPVWRPTK